MLLARWIVHKRDKVNFIGDTWIPHSNAIQQSIQEPILREEEHLKIRDIHENKEWDFGKLSFSLLQNLKNIISNYSFPPGENKENILVTSNGLFSIGSSYSNINESLQKNQ